MTHDSSHSHIANKKSENEGRDEVIDGHAEGNWVVKIKLAFCGDLCPLC